MILPLKFMAKLEDIDTTVYKPVIVHMMGKDKKG